jgi:hypothetical protein
MLTRRWPLLLLVLTGIVAFAWRPRAQGPAAEFYAIGDLPGGGATTIIRDATRSGDLIYAVGEAVTRLTNCGNPPTNPGPCSVTDTRILWRFDETTATATREALPDIDPNTEVSGLNGVPDITPDGRYIASQARIADGIGFSRRPVRVDTSLLPSPLANLDLNTLLPGLGAGTTALATSSDGTILYGNGNFFPGPVTRAIRLDTIGATSLVIPLLGLATQNNVASRGASADGRVVVGGSSGAGFNRAYRYEHGSGVSAIPTLPGGTVNAALAVSPDGDLLLMSGNSASNPTRPEAYLYRASTNAVQPLGSPNAAFRTGGRICASGICNPALQIQGGMTADGSVVAMNFTSAAGGSGHAYFHNANGWFHLASALGANGVHILADGWQNLVISSISSDGTLVFGAGDHNGVVEGFVAEFGAGVLANFNPQAAPPVSTSLVGAWNLCDSHDPDCDVSALNGPTDSIVVFTADGAYYVIEETGFERGLYSFDGSALSFTTLLDTSGEDGASYLNGALLSPVIVAGDTIMPPGPLLGIRFPGSIAEPLVGAWVNGNPTLPGSSFVAVLLGSAHGHRVFQASDGPIFGVGSELGTYTWDPNTHQFVFTPDGGPSDAPELLTLSADGLSLPNVILNGEPFEFVRVIDPATIPVIVNAPLSASGVVEQALSYDVDATNTATFAATGLPDGLSINPGTGVISGAPTVGGQFLVTIFATNTAGVSDIETLTLTVAMPTPVGQSVIVEPEVPEGAAPVTLSFEQIAAAGTTTVEVLDAATSPPPPGGFQIGSQAFYYEITTDAVLAPNTSVALCFNVAGVDFGGETPRLFHFESGAWVNITTSFDTATQTLCGSTLSFSAFAIFSSSNPSALLSVGNSSAWIGLKNSDDQGTRFDLRTELYRGNSLLTSGLTRCIAGVTRNANSALQAVVPLAPLAPSESVPLAPGDVLTLRISTRIGTNPNGTKCAGHNNATGLRLYYDGATRQSRIDAVIAPAPATAYFLRSFGTANKLDVQPPSGTAKFKDSPAVNFSGGNAWKTIGDWTLSIP